MKDQIGIELSDDLDHTDGETVFTCQCCKVELDTTHYTLYDISELVADYNDPEMGVWCDPCNTEQCTQGGFYPGCTYREDYADEYDDPYDETTALGVYAANAMHDELYTHPYEQDERN